MRLTDETIAKLEADFSATSRAELVVFDDDLAGFGVRLRKGGSRRYVFQYKLGHQQRRLTFHATTVAKGRFIAGGWKEKVSQGIDVAAEKQEARQATADTFESCMWRYLEWLDTSNRRPRTKDAITRHLEKNLSALHRRPIRAITRRDITEALAALDKRAPSQGNRSRASLSRFFNWSIERGYLESNVALHVTANDERQARDRVLSNGEVCAVWHALAQDQYGDIVKLLALTAQRLREISDLKWSEVDFQAATIMLPPSRTKNRLAHTVPLSAPALAILKARYRNRDPDRDFVFGLRGPTGFCNFTVCKQRLDQQAKLSDKWVLHDIRRTVATGMAELGIAPPHVIESLLNHVTGHARGGALALVYNRAKYLKEARRAMEKWAAHLTKVVAQKPAQKLRKAA